MRRRRAGPGLSALTLCLTLVVHWILGRVLASSDVLARVLVGRDVLTVLLVVATLGIRLFLYLVAPGWALFVLARSSCVRAVWARAAASRERGQTQAR